jgi:hypothetical protein
VLSRRGRSFAANASGFDTHRDSISSRLDCREAVSGAFPAATAATAAVSPESYLQQHGIIAKMEDAFNSLMAAKPSDPMAFLAASLQKA